MMTNQIVETIYKLIILLGPIPTVCAYEMTIPFIVEDDDKLAIMMPIYKDLSKNNEVINSAQQPIDHDNLDPNYSNHMSS